MAKVVITDREREEANLKKLKKIVVSNDGLVSSALSAILELCRDKAERILFWGNTLPLLIASVKGQSLYRIEYIAPTDYRFLLAVEFDVKRNLRVKARQEHGLNTLARKTEQTRGRIFECRYRKQFLLIGFNPPIPIIHSRITRYIEESRLYDKNQD